MYMRSRYSTESIVLADFAPFHASPPTPQEDSALMLAWGIAAAKCIEQGAYSDTEARAVFEEVKARVLRYSVSPSYIKQRRMALAPSNYSPASLRAPFSLERITSLAGTSRLLNHPQPNDLNHLDPPLDRRMALYEEVVDGCLAGMYRKDEEGPDHMIHVTCSGYISPSPVEKLVSEKRWWNTTVTHSYHMGCYGSLPAIRMAHGFLASSMLGATSLKSRVDLVHTELFSAHMDLTKESAGNILTMTLFGDGFVRYSAYPESVFAGQRRRGLKILGMREHIIPDSVDGMTWNLGASSFQMTLSIKVPLYIKDAVAPFVETLFRDAGLDFEAERRNLVYAIHPGGPAIINHIADRLNLDDGYMDLSRKILYENGNISSATLPTMFHEIVRSAEIPPGTRVLAMAFGPGLTVSGLLLEKV